MNRAIPAGGGRSVHIIDHTFVNSVPRVVDGKIILADGARRGGDFSVDSSATEAELNAQLIAPKSLNAAEQGDAVRIEADGKTFVLLSQRIYEDSLDYSPWTAQGIDLLADEALELVSGDGLDELDPRKEFTASDRSRVSIFLSPILLSVALLRPP